MLLLQHLQKQVNSALNTSSHRRNNIRHVFVLQKKKKKDNWLHMCSHLGFWMFRLAPYNLISIYLYSLRSQNLCLTVPCEGKLNLLLYLFPLRRHSISNSEPPKHNQLSELQWQRMQNADKTL